MKLHMSTGNKKHGICSSSGDLVASMLLDDICLGVSSRAVGSVEEKLGTLVVGDDLELVGWDVVVENSTPGAKMASNMDDLQQYIESDLTRNNKIVISEKLQKINKILY